MYVALGLNSNDSNARPKTSHLQIFSPQTWSSERLQMPPRASVVSLNEKAPRVTLDCIYPLLQSQIQIIAEVCKESGEKYLERQVAGADERRERTG